jgi:hypothetical protein
VHPAEAAQLRLQKQLHASAQLQLVGACKENIDVSWLLLSLGNCIGTHPGYNIRLDSVCHMP